MDGRRRLRLSPAELFQPDASAMKTENRPRVSSQDEDVISGFPQDSTSRLTFLSCLLLPVLVILCPQNRVTTTTTTTTTCWQEVLISLYWWSYWLMIPLSAWNEQINQLFKDGCSQSTSLNWWFCSLTILIKFCCFGSLTVCFVVFILSTLLFFCNFIVLYHYAKRLPVIAFIKPFALMLDSDEIIPKRDLILFLDAEMSIKWCPQLFLLFDISPKLIKP